MDSHIRKMADVYEGDETDGHVRRWWASEMYTRRGQSRRRGRSKWNTIIGRECRWKHYKEGEGRRGCARIHVVAGASVYTDVFSRGLRGRGKEERTREDGTRSDPMNPEGCIEACQERGRGATGEYGGAEEENGKSNSDNGACLPLWVGRMT
ncbi:hypothetical protein B0H13DRAFT_1861864 [Mycena leptocephala]|nr:hypothetical protein B0H13DRAFT_1861864 [Mycena leptocephala]